MATVADIAAALEAWAPLASAFDYDNVGLQVGRRNQAVGRVLVALDLTSTLIEEAEELGAQLIVTHHPLFFKPVTSISDRAAAGALALRLAEESIAYYAVHTNLDVAHGGVSFGLAERLGLGDIRFLQPAVEALAKLAIFVPKAHANAVRSAITAAGAGRIGEYEACSFETEGMGRFRPGDSARPHIGDAGGAVESVPEVRVEVEINRWDLNRVLSAARSAHPYEEMAYDVFPMEKPASRIGSGAIGLLPAPTTLELFVGVVSERLEAGSVRYSGDADRSIRTVAVCGGSGSSLIGRAIGAGADAFVTGDITYHRYFETLDAEGAHRMALIDPGHYETEAHTEAIIVNHLARQFPDVVFHRTRHRTSPMLSFAHR